MPAAARMVRAHAQMMRVANPRRTAEGRFIEPTPTIAPVIVCVVETGMSAAAELSNVIAAAASAENPPMGFNAVILMPMVFTIRYPPESVPSPIAGSRIIGFI